VPDNQTVLRIEHAQALIHVVESFVETKMLFAASVMNLPTEYRCRQRKRCCADEQRLRECRFDACEKEQDAHRSQTRDGADQAGECDQSPVALAREISRSSKHGLRRFGGRNGSKLWLFAIVDDQLSRPVKFRDK